MCIRDRVKLLDRTAQTVRTWISDLELSADRQHRYPTAPLLERKREVEARGMKPEAAGAELADPITWADKLKAKQVEKLDVQIAELRGELWSRADVMTSFSEYNARLRGTLENWRQSRGAKDGTPDGKRLIDELADAMIKEVHDEFRPAQ